jgi:hypothetical protein
MNHLELETTRFAAVAVKSWKIAIDQLNELTGTLSDDDLQQRVAPGKNRVYYLIGHLAAVHDRLFTLLGIGERQHPELDEQFLFKPDGALPDTIRGGDLRKTMVDVSARLTVAFEGFSAEDWLTKHTAVSDADFAIDPLRNRLAVVLSRTMHAQFHAGQIRLTRASA